MKRVLLLSLLAGLLAASNCAHADQRWRFRVLLDDSDIGTHEFRLVDRDGDRRVESDARFAVTFLAVEVYRYMHTAIERWHGGCLDSIDARTDDNGEVIDVRGNANGGGFEVRGPAGLAKVGQACMMSFAYWNPVFLGQKHLLNAQTGEVVDVDVERIGDETLVVRGAPTPVRRYALHGPKLRIDLWYTPDWRWVQLESRTSRGNLLRYVLL